MLRTKIVLSATARGLVTASLVLAGVASAAPGGTPGPPSGKGEDAAGNRLSFPVLFTASPIEGLNEAAMGLSSLTGDYWLWNGLDDANSVVCQPSDPTCTLDPAASTRVYVQKDPDNVWQGYFDSALGTVAVAHADVSDNLESVPWRTTSTVRVEFVPFADTTNMTLAAAFQRQAFQMVYLVGQGVSEVWGVVGDPGEIVHQGRLVPMSYATVYSPCVWVSFTKIGEGAGNPEQAPEDAHDFTWEASQDWSSETVYTETVDARALRGEINVKGRVIFGDSWRVKNTKPLGATTEGWWRITFFDTCATAPFDLSGLLDYADPTAAAGEEGEEGDEGGSPAPSTYPRVPDHDASEGIVWIDVYIQTRASGGGGGGGPGSGGGGGGGGGPPDDRGGGPPSG